MPRSLLGALLIALATVAIQPSTSGASPCVMAPPAELQSFDFAAALSADMESLPRPTPVASWTLLGCWKSRPWVTTCLDVFRDETGALYICKACGTTGNPNKGKCRATTQSELDSGTWCGATQ